MFNTIKQLLGFGPKINYKELVKNGAQLIDVRSQGEFSGGHIFGSENIPLQSIAGNLGKIKKDKAIIVFCASGMRSASAKAILKANGFNEVHNAGSWMSLKSKL